MFRSPLELIAAPEPDFWLTGAALVWVDPVFGALQVPVGFRTDLASIPRLFRNLPFLDPDGLSRRPAVVHDFLYGSKLGRRLGKPFADQFLRTALVAEGASPHVAAAFYYAVHWFGGAAWAEDAAKGALV
jgi:Protein of unknown function (DUF1353)